MNFLSHFYFEQHHNNAYQCYGVAFPDLYKNFNRRASLPKDPGKINVSSKNEESLIKGWNRHLIVDEIFHDSDFFKNKTAELKEALQHIDFGQSRVKLYSLAHVMLELILDGMLIRTEKADPELYYKRLESIDANFLQTFLEKINLWNSGYIKFMDQYNKHRYVFHYSKEGSIVFALTRIFSRLLGKELEFNASQMEDLIRRFFESWENDYFTIFEEISLALDS